MFSLFRNSMPIERIIEAESIAEGSFKADTTPATNANKNSGNNREDSPMTSKKGLGANKGPSILK